MDLSKDDKAKDESQSTRSSAASELIESGWVSLVWLALGVLAAFGFLFNIAQESTSDDLIVEVVNLCLLAYTNFLAYPWLLFVGVGSLKRFGLVSRELRQATLFLFFVAPFAVIAVQLVVRILQRLW